MDWLTEERFGLVPSWEANARPVPKARYRWFGVPDDDVIEQRQRQLCDALKPRRSRAP